MGGWFAADLAFISRSCDKSGCDPFVSVADILAAMVPPLRVLNPAFKRIPGIFGEEGFGAIAVGFRGFWGDWPNILDHGRK